MYLPPMLGKGGWRGGGGEGGDGRRFQWVLLLDEAAVLPGDQKVGPVWHPGDGRHAFDRGQFDGARGARSRHGALLGGEGGGGGVRLGTRSGFAVARTGTHLEESSGTTYALAPD